jgi:hypothetical protein
VAPAQLFVVTLALSLARAMLGLAALCALAAVQSAAAADAYKGTRTPIKAPECIADAAQSFFVDNVPQSEVTHNIVPTGRFYAIARYLGSEAQAYPTGYDFGRFPATYPSVDLRDAPLTGLSIADDRAPWQRAARADATADTSSAVQLYCDHFGSYINSWAFPSRTLVGEGPHAVYAFDFPEAERPLLYDTDPDVEAVIEADIEIPWLATWIDPQAPLPYPPLGQVSLFFYLRDRATGKPLAVLVEIFDNRFAAATVPAASAMHDTEVPFLSIPLSPVARFATPLPKSGYFTGVPWSGLRNFGVRIGQAEFRAGIAAINQMCGRRRELPFCNALGADGDAYADQPQSYEVTSFGLIHEVFGVDDNNHLSMGMHAARLGMWRIR